MIDPFAGDIITALATPPGISALAVIRISGPSLDNLYSQITHSKAPPKPRFARQSRVFNSQGHLIDSCILTFFEKPKSFTGEDVIEISCHGGEFTPAAILKTLYSFGLRKAEPGEFSYRAFLNGKIDLLQAESISGLISAKTQLNASIQLKNINGFLSNSISEIKDSVFHLLTVIEHELDFSEEEITHTSLDEIKRELLELQKNITTMLSTSSLGDTIRSGIRIVLFGKPNSGKSSLFNRIVGSDKAIVTHIPGTTRDIIEAWQEINGIPVCFVDTAGFHDTDELVESLGIQRTRGEVTQSDILFVLDEKDPEQFYKQFSSEFKNKIIIYIQSKSDLYLPNIKSDNVIYISLRQECGIDMLFTKLSTIISSKVDHNLSESAVIISNRQAAVLGKACDIINIMVDCLKSMGDLDIFSSLLRELLDCLEELFGKIDNEEILNSIFSDFCVGK